MRLWPSGLVVLAAYRCRRGQGYPVALFPYGRFVLPALAADAIIIAIKAVRIWGKDREPPVRDVSAVQIRRWGAGCRDWVGRVTVPLGGRWSGPATYLGLPGLPFFELDKEVGVLDIWRLTLPCINSWESQTKPCYRDGYKEVNRTADFLPAPKIAYGNLTCHPLL